MLAIAISVFFAFAGGFAVFAIVLTERSHVGAWDRLAAERRALQARDAGDRFPVTVTTRPPLAGAGANFQGRLLTRSGAGPFSPAPLRGPASGRRAAA